jgi:hypothetical protein
MVSGTCARAGFDILYEPASADDLAAHASGQQQHPRRCSSRHASGSRAQTSVTVPIFQAYGKGAIYLAASTWRWSWGHKPVKSPPHPHLAAIRHIHHIWPQGAGYPLSLRNTNCTITDCFNIRHGTTQSTTSPKKAAMIRSTEPCGAAMTFILRQPPAAVTPLPHGFRPLLVASA